jgi:hypothetical protein
MAKMRNGAPVVPPDARGPLQEQRAPQEAELGAMLKADLIDIANSLGVSLDGSETKADLITMIENARRGASRAEEPPNQGPGSRAD